MMIRNAQRTRPRIGIDCDGVMANFTKAYLQAIYVETGSLHDIKEVTQWDIHKCQFFTDAAEASGMTARELRDRVSKHVVKPGFCAEIEPLVGAKDAIAELQSIGEVFVITSPWDSSQTWQYERLHWLVREMGFQRTHVMQTGTKHPIHCDVFVDDKLAHCIDVAVEWPDSHVILFDAHHNKADDDKPMPGNVRRGTWADVLASAHQIFARFAASRPEPV